MITIQSIVLHSITHEKIAKKDGTSTPWIKAKFTDDKGFTYDCAVAKEAKIAEKEFTEEARLGKGTLDIFIQDKAVNKSDGTAYIAKGIKMRLLDFTAN